MATEHLAVVLELMTGQYQREARAAATSSDRLAQSTGEAARTTDRMGSAAVTAGQKIARSEGEYHDLARSIAKSTREAAELDEELIQLGRSFDLNEKEARQFAQSMKRAAADTNDAAVATDVATAKFETNASKIRGGLATLGIGLGVAEVGRFFMDSVRDAAELEQAVGGVQAVFGDLSDEILDASRTAADNVGLSQRAYDQLAARLGGQLQTFGFSLDDTVDKTQDLIRVGADLAATYGGTVEEAIEAISSLLRGETNPIERYAIAINQTAINARAMELGLANSADSVDIHAKAVAGLDLLYEQAARSMGQFEREAGTASGQLERQRADLENMRAEIGTNLLPLFTEILGLVRDMTPAIKDMASTATELVEPFADVLSILREIESLQLIQQGMRDPLGLDEIGQDLPLLERFQRHLGRQLNLLSPQGQFAHWNEFRKVVVAAFSDTAGASDNARIEGLKYARDVEAGLDIVTRKTDTARIEGMKYARDVEKAMREVPNAITAQEAPIDGLIGKLLEAQAAAGSVFETLRTASDPVFAAVDAWGKYVEALKAADEEGETVEETLDVLRAKVDMKAALDRLGSNYDEAMQALSLATGVPISELDRLLGMIEGFDGQTFKAVFETEFRSTGTPPSQLTGNPNFQPIPRQSGGRVFEGRAHLVGEGGRELFFPDQDGMMLNNQATERLLHSLTSGAGDFRVPSNGRLPGRSGDMSALLAALERIDIGRGGDFIANFERTDPETDAQLVGHLRSIQRRMETA